jgi:hypothetical protein
MTMSRALARPADRCLEKEREDLEGLFADMILEVFGEDAEVVATGSQPDDGLDGGAAALVAIHDESDDTYLGVHVRVSSELAQHLAEGMSASVGTDREDRLHAVGELARIAAGRLTALLFPAARLSLPSATLDAVGLPSARDDAADPTVLRARVRGGLAELALVPHVDGDGLAWPPSMGPGVLEAEA